MCDVQCAALVLACSEHAILHDDVLHPPNVDYIATHLELFLT
jgi:hypothetical protein